MFIARLDPTQQGVLLHLGTRLISADDNLDGREVEFLETLRSQMGAGVQPVDIDSLAEVFTSQQSKAALLLELIGLAHADADYHSTEQSFVAQVANKLGIAKEMLEDMEAWVVRQLALVREAEQYMESQ